MEKNTGIQTLSSKESVLLARVLVFDMDGTLYQHDGINGGMSGSSLERSILENSKKFIIDTEGCSEAIAESLVGQGLEDEIGISNFLSKRYGITRADYFKVAWNIDPFGIVKNYEIPVRVVKSLAGEGKRLLLLTAAPKVWQEIVVDFIGLTGYFQRIFTGEDYGEKKQIFESLSQKYGASNVCSIGDQLTTDIIPAREAGMSTFMVTNPSDLEIITSGVKYE